ncbi:hypothetical protein GF362_04930 [Candidatus Dojkabacteria bacterium]|nr:hypothetical protein [Candidatus Dojkabacteria bacterium]
MRESQTGNIIESAEIKALQEIEKVSDPGKMEPISQIINRIKKINKSIRGLDLVIESKTFQELANVTRVKLPRLNDRLIFGIKILQKGVSESREDSYQYISKACNKLFEWDQNILFVVNKNLKDLKRYTKIKKGTELKKYTKDMINNYPFKNDLYEQYLSTQKEKTKDLKTNFYLTIPFIKEIGDLISIYDSLKTVNKIEEGNIDVTIGFAKYTLNHLNLPSIYIVDLIPSLIRSIARNQGIQENKCLRMSTYELVQIAKNFKVGKTLVEISKAIIHEDKKIITRSRTGKYLWSELKSKNFWEDTTYLPKISMLQNIANEGEKPAKIKSNNQFDKHIGKLASIIYSN